MEDRCSHSESICVCVLSVARYNDLHACISAAFAHGRALTLFLFLSCVVRASVIVCVCVCVCVHKTLCSLLTATDDVCISAAFVTSSVYHHHGNTTHTHLASQMCELRVCVGG
eukprot:Tamp_31371.p1 GENE.Tamp_31371~~Tamp_31371.p1  ORF type:complete len:113 (+),score=8.87 Tamp_31371:199-537(+)